MTFGFTANPGTDFSSGSEPELAKRLAALARGEHLNIFGISGARTPAHSVAVGGFANDPHTRGDAADIGVGGSLRASAAQLSDATLAKYGLKRPYHTPAEVNHIELASKPGLVGQVVHDVGSMLDPTPIDNAIGGVVGDAASSAAKSTVDALAGALGADGARILLYVGLVGLGATLIVAGAMRTVGVKPSTVARTAAIGAL